MNDTSFNNNNTHNPSRTAPQIQHYSQNQYVPTPLYHVNAKPAYTQICGDVVIVPHVPLHAPTYITNSGPMSQPQRYVM